MTFNFDKLKRPAGTTRPVNPIEIFRSIPALAASPNDLWQGQSKALEAWHDKRKDGDVLISLHTGAGKSLVGLLIAQSLIHEGVSRVLYLCATNDLVMQTAKEATSKLGFQLTTRMEGVFSNNLYETGQGFCLTNYQALFHGFTTFTRDKRPEAIIFDDAHVAEKIIRDCYTVKIEAKDHAELFANIVALATPYLSAIGKTDYFNGIVSGESSHRTAMLPPHVTAALCREHNLLEIFHRFNLQKGRTAYALQHLGDHLETCNVFVSRHAIEIAPAFLPSKRIDYLVSDQIRRVYLSATLTSEVDFVRAFGKRPSSKIEPESDAGIGERLIILSDVSTLVEAGRGGVTAERVAQLLAQKHKLLISTSSYLSAQKYKNIAVPPRSETFSAELEAFRIATTPCAFVLVARVDGIDLPHSTCRVMLADGLPAGFSLYETYLFDFLEMRNSFAAKLANRITQMFGRTNRGRNDYSVIFALDREIVAWLSAPRNVALLPELLRKQLLLGKSLIDQFGIRDVTQFASLADQVISRDPGWLAYYQASIGGLEIGDDQRAQAAEDDSLIRDAALAEAEFGAKIWDRNPGGARMELAEVVDKIVVADRRLGGWYNIQIGMTYDLEGDADAAAHQYAEARSRTNFQLALPLPKAVPGAGANVKPKNSIHQNLLNIFSNEISVQNDILDRYKRQIELLFDDRLTASDHEAAIRALGELLGFVASRPEQEADTGSTLDVLWLSPHTRQSLPIELKTNKRSQSSLINMRDIGQCFIHLEWLKSTHPDFAVLGMLIVGGVAKLSPETQPSEQMWHTNVNAFKSLYEETMVMLKALQRMTPLDRYAEISALCVRPEWQLGAIFAKIKGQLAMTLK
jgi:Type III restriction enzyme, res subunit